jgi:hypothetical protein
MYSSHTHRLGRCQILVTQLLKWRRHCTEHIPPEVYFKRPWCSSGVQRLLAEGMKELLGTMRGVVSNTPGFRMLSYQEFIPIALELKLHSSAPGTGGPAEL